MAKITISEVKKDVQVYDLGYSFIEDENMASPPSENAYKKFIKEYKDINKELSLQLKNDSGDAKDLIKSLDDVVIKILNYRYNIVDHLSYCDNDDYWLSHKTLKS